jgi:hypothetical protein
MRIRVDDGSGEGKMCGSSELEKFKSFMKKMTLKLKIKLLHSRESKGG